MEPAPPPEAIAPMPYGKIFLAVIGCILIAIAALSGSMYLLAHGSEEDERDATRSYDLTFIESGIRDIYEADRKLPATLDQVLKRWKRSFPLSITDPTFKVPYEYRVMNANTFELCAHFETRIDKPHPSGHPDGRFCITTSLD